MFFIPSPLTDFSKAYVVYKITAQNQTIWLGACTLSEFPLLQDARRNETIRGYLQNEEFINCADIVILSIDFSEETATNKMYGFRMHSQCSFPFVERDKAKQQKGRMTRSIECVDTGELFNSASEACRAYDIKHSNLSSHMKTGRGTVKGLRFRYVE